MVRREVVTQTQYIGVFSVVDTTTINLKEFSTILATASLIVECAGIACAGTTATLGN
jgi:hypothetical protein